MGACSDSPFSPPDKYKPTPPNGTQLGVVEVTISGIGTPQMSASARPAFPPTTANLEGPATGGPSEGTIQIEPVSVGSFTVGERPPAGNGVRYVYATYIVANAQFDGDDDPNNNPVYANARQNLTFLAIDTGPTTHGHTAVKTLRLFGGEVVNDPEATNIAKQIIPTGRVKRTPNGDVDAEIADVLQVYTETEVQTFKTALLANDPGSSVTDIFPYGFVVKSPNVLNGERTLPGSPAPGQFDGLVTFAFKLPLQEVADDDPFEISLMFLPVDDTQERITQSLEEQNPEGLAALEERVAALNPASVTVLPGSIYPRTASVPTNYQCTGVRVAGMDGGADEVLLFPTAPAITSKTPDPFAAGRSSISNAATFQFGLDASANNVNSSTFVVHSRQHGNQSASLTYGSGTTISATGASFSPGEFVEITLTSGLNLCKGPQVFQYRVGVTGGSGTFTASELTTEIDEAPTGVALGFVSGNASMDMVVVNAGSANSGEIFVGNGDGTFTPLPSTAAAGNNPSSVTAGDFDNDGDLDVVSTNESADNLTIIINEAPLNTQNISVGDSPQDADTGDLDGDGDLDLVVANANSDNVSVLLNDGNGNFSVVNTIPVGSEPKSIALGDFDNEGVLDMAVALFGPNEVKILKGLGRQGEFISSNNINVETDPIALALGDLDNDGNLDIVVANSGHDDISILLGNGDRTFTLNGTIEAGTFPSAVVVGDFDGANNLDIAFSNKDDGTLRVLYNDGNGNFSAFAGVLISVGVNPVAIAVGDIDGNGSLDIAVANNGDGTVTNPGSVSILLDL